MTVFFSPDGTLNIAADPSDLPETSNESGSSSGAMVRCKNLRTNEPGKAKTRDGSAKLNTVALETAIWWIEEQGGSIFTFAGTQIYEDGSSIDTGLTSAQWTAIKYNAFNDTVQNVYALNGTDRKRIQASTVFEWGIEAPTTAPTLSIGAGTGLNGQYNAKYTYCRKDGETLIAESNGSPAADINKNLVNQSLGIDVDESPSDSQITHVRTYRTLSGGTRYFMDQETAVGSSWAFAYMHEWEATDAYFSGTGFKFTETDTVHGTEDTYTWELAYESLDDDAKGIDDDYRLNEDRDYHLYWDDNDISNFRLDID